MLTYPMEERGSLPLYEYLCRRIRADILSGALPAGTRLPSKRALAEHLRVSVVTVESAYSQLEAEGYLQARPKRGFFVSAVEQGRGIYANIKKAIHYLLSCNIGEILTIFCATVFHFHQMPLVPVQLLWLNLVTDSLPALALGVEPVEEGVMSQPPRDAHASLFAHGFAFRLAWQGVMVGLLTLAAYFLGEYVLSDPGEAHAAANTMAFATLTLCQLFHAFDVRSERSSLFHIGVFSNPAMNKAFLIGLTMQLAVLCVPPLQVVFSTVPMSPLEWAVVLALAITPVVVCELAKAVSRGRTRRPARAEKVEPACARR